MNETTEMTDAVWESAGESVGGPRGRFAARRTGAAAWFTHRRVLLLLTAVSAVIAYLIKTPCFAINWASPDVFSRGCYTDWPVIFAGRGLAEGTYPFISPGVKVEYPVLLAGFATVAAMLTPGTGLSPERNLVFFEINAVLAAIAWAGLTLITAATALRLQAAGVFSHSGSHSPGWGSKLERGAAVALSPAIITTIFINWDIYAVLLAAAGLWAIVTRRWVLAGVMIGLGTAFKLYPILLLGVVFLGALRAGNRKRAWMAFAVTTASAVISWLAVNLPAMLKDFAGWKYFLDFSREREAGFSSVWFAYNLMVDPAAKLGPQQINTLGMVSLLLLLAAITAFAWLSPMRASSAQLAFLIVAAFILTNKVYSPQFVIWLVPLAVLAGLPWRWLLGWQLVEVLHWWAVWEALAKWTTGGNSQHSLPDGVYLAAVWAHVVMIAAMMVWVVMTQLRKVPVEVPSHGAGQGAA